MCVESSKFQYYTITDLHSEKNGDRSYSSLIFEVEKFYEEYNKRFCDLIDTEILDSRSLYCTHEIYLKYSQV